MRKYMAGRWDKFRTVLAWGYMLRNYYGERLRDYPRTVAMKMLLSRFIFLTQLPLLIPDRPSLVDCYGGVKLYIPLWAHPISIDVALGTYEYRKTELFFNLVRAGMTILDIGACGGTYSILAAKLMQDKGKVLAFEPDPDNCEWLEKNIRANNYNCVEIHRYALADKEAMATFYPAGGMGSLVSRSSRVAQSQKEAMMIRTRRLDDVLSELNIQKVDVIKIDVEGSDILVLKGAERTLRNGRVHLLMDVDVECNVERTELYDLLTSFGYEIYRIGKQLVRIKSADGLFLFRNHVVANAPNPKFDMDATLSVFEKRIRSIIPPKLLPIVGSLYYSLRPQFGTPKTVREIYARKK